MISLIEIVINPPTVGYNGYFTSMKTMLFIFSLIAFIGLSSFDTTFDTKSKNDVSNVVSITTSIKPLSNTALFEVPVFVSLVETQPTDVEGPFRNYLTDFCNYDANGTYYCCYNIGTGKPYCQPETPPGPR